MPVFVYPSEKKPITHDDLSREIDTYDLGSKDLFSKEGDWLKAIFEASRYITRNTQDGVALNLEPSYLWIPEEAFVMYSSKLSQQVQDKSWIGSAVELMPCLKCIAPKPFLKDVAILFDPNACDAFMFNNPRDWGFNYPDRPNLPPGADLPVRMCVQQGVIFLKGEWTPGGAE